MSWFKLIISAYPHWVNAKRHAKDLTLVLDNTQRINTNDLLAFMVVRNETLRLPFFLDYYQRLGINHFLFIDNDSSDGLMDLLKSRQDCSVWHTKASYKAAKYGVYWLNELLRRYGTGHWCLTVDADEFLHYPYCDTRSLRELTDFLTQEGKDCFFSLMLDMYSEKNIDTAHYHAGQDPLSVCAWFDGSGYYQDKRPTYNEWWIRGGVRRRVFFADNPELAPALNKTVLIKWRSYYAYISSTHIAWPKRLNRPHFSDTLAPTGCLLHFKYLSLMREKVEEEMQRQEHYAGSREYQRYLDGLNQHTPLWCQASVKFSNWRQCVDLGLMNIGRWF
ncbi:glycosyltransferase family 2 protein [Methylocucumis oryzae]|nr:glycosyltransferase family 2 protein [Methylocucumis oryzae]